MEDMKKTTDELVNEIDGIKDVGAFLAANTEEMLEIDFAEYVGCMMEKYQVTKSQLLKRAKLLTGSYRYELLRGEKRRPDRDIVIKLCFGFPLGIEDAQRLMRLAGVPPLYPRNQRDALILFALKNGYDRDQTNDLLDENQEEIIGYE